MGAVDDKYFAGLAKMACRLDWSAEKFVDLLVGLDDEQSAAFLAWADAGLQELVDARDHQNLVTLQAATRFWCSPKVTTCVRAMTRRGLTVTGASAPGLPPRLVFTKMVRQGPDWTRRVIAGVLKPRTDEIPFGAVLSAVGHFDLPVPDSERFVVIWAEAFAGVRWWDDVPGAGLWRVDADGQVVGPEDSRAFFRRLDPDRERFFSTTPHLEQVVCRVVGSPTALQAVHGSEPEPTFTGLVTAAVTSGGIGRQPVLDAVLDALDTTGYRPGAQRALVTILAGLDLTTDDVATVLPRMVSLLGIAPSTGATMLWEHLVTMELAPQDLLEIGTVLLSRKEKKLWAALVAYLVRVPATSPLLGTAVELCTQAASLDDRATARRAQKFVEQHACDQAVRDDAPIDMGEWTAGPPAQWRTLWDLPPAVAVTDIPRMLAGDIAAREEPWWWAGDPLPGLVRECSARPAGGTYLCVPTYSDWTVSFDDLLARVKAARDEGYWPHDLAQALLRLEPTDPARAAELDGLTLPCATKPGFRLWVTKGPDGVGLIRTWVAAGGITIPEAVFDGRGDAVLPDLMLPVVVPGVPAMGRLTGNEDSELSVAMAPLAVEHICSAAQATHTKALNYHWRYRPHTPGALAVDQRHIARTHGPFGRATYTYLALHFADVDGTAVDDVIDLALQGRFDPHQFIEALRHLMALPPTVESGFSLVRVAARCDQAAQAGALAGIWPVVTAMAVTAVISPKIPTGTLDIVRVGTAYAPTASAHLPADEVLPPEVRTFAASKSTSKAALEARAWVSRAT